jgi:hypothetical protein
VASECEWWTPLCFAAQYCTATAALLAAAVDNIAVLLQYMISSSY